MKAILVVSLLLAAAASALKTNDNNNNSTRKNNNNNNNDNNNLQFRVCGNYCGPNWCASTVIPEQRCVATHLWGSPAEAGSCADACCKTHDYCCGAGDRHGCNHAIVSCIQSNHCYLSVCGAAVWLAMKTVSGWCCGSPCPTYSSPGTVLSLAQQSFCGYGLRLAFDTDTVHVRSLALAEHPNPNTNPECPAQQYYLNTTTNDVIIGHLDTTYASLLYQQYGPSLTAGSPHGSQQCLRGIIKGTPLAAASTVVYWPHEGVLAINDAEGKLHTMKPCTV